MEKTTIPANLLDLTYEDLKRLRARKTLSELREMKPEPPKRCIIYFIRAGENIKIGLTRAGVTQRLKSLSSSHWESMEVLATIKNVTAGVEQELHARFGHLRIRPDREWFRPGPDLLSYIEGL